MPRISKKMAKNIGKGVNTTNGLGPLGGPDVDKIFKQVSDSPPPLIPIEESAKADEKKKKMKKSIFNT